MKFSIVTPSFDRPDFLDETISSVLSQAGDFEIEYVVQDGGSNESVVRILDHWKGEVESGRFAPRCNAVRFSFNVARDNGMYDAINKGFSQTNGDLMAWINSDDMYYPNCFSAIAQALQQHEDVDWLIGPATAFNHQGSAVRYGYDPRAYSRKFIQDGFYRGDVREFEWLSQDSVFWRRSLWEKAGTLATNHELVSDFNLWQAFAQHADLVKIEALVAGYRSHGSQLTGDASAYPRELGDPAQIPKRLYWLSRMCFRCRGLGRFATHRMMHPLSKTLYGVSYDALFGRVISWDFSQNNWIIHNSRILP